MLCMAVYAVAGPIAMPEETPASNMESSKALSKPIDIKIDLGLLSKLLRLPHPLASLTNGAEPLQLKVSVGKPSIHDQEENREASQEREPKLLEPSFDPDGGIEVEESTPYTTYRGNGTPQQGWPTQEEWISYGSM